MAIISKLVYKGLKANLPTTRSADSFYLCTDTRELYFGAELYTEAVRFYNGAANKPTTPAQGVLYIDEATGKGEAWDGTAWKPVITPVTVSAGDNSVEIGGTATAPTVKVKLSTKEGNLRLRPARKVCLFLLPLLLTPTRLRKRLLPRLVI